MQRSGDSPACLHRVTDAGRRTEMNEEEKKDKEDLISALEKLVAGIAPYAARHKANKCYCKICNNLRFRVLQAAQLLERLQPPTL